MALYVQLKGTKGDQWHVVESYEEIGWTPGRSSLDFDRRYRTGCGLTKEAPAHRLAEADAPPWTHRHRHKGCFETASDPIS